MLGGHRTSVRLESIMWDALDEIAAEKGTTIHNLLAEIHRTHNQANLSSAIRVYIVDFYRRDRIRSP
jgi:predicted DNA-binding ribbon-helix-helix protein